MGIKLGIVGLGSFGRAFVQLFKAHPLVDKIALCDIEESKLKYWSEQECLKDKFNPRDAYRSLDEICQADLDAIVVITQPWLHAPQCLQVMESGKHVYSAVPVISLPDFDETLDWCGKLIETTKRTGMHYMLGETTIYRPQTMYCRHKAQQGAFGNFVYAEGEYVHDVDWSCCSLRHVQASRTTGAVGKQYNAVMEKYWKKGIFSSPMNYPTHSVSGPLSVMDSLPNKVSAIGYRNANNDDYFAHSNFSNVTAFYHMDNGACLRIAEYREISGNVGCDDEDFRIFGTSGSYSNLQWRENGRVIPDGTPLENKVTQLDLNSMRDPLPQEVADAFNMMLNKDAKPGDDFIPSGHGGSHPYLVHEFVSSVAENRIPAISAWDAAAYMAMGAAAHKSALKDGELVKVHHFGRAPRNN